jgi:hypothetical protein
LHRSNASDCTKTQHGALIVLAMRNKWLVFLLLMAVFCAASTTYCLANYPRVVPYLDAALLLAIGSNVVAAPVIWGVVLAKPAPGASVALWVHAALCTVLGINCLSDVPVLDGPPGAAVAAIGLILIFVSTIGGVVMAVTRRRARTSWPDRKALPFVYLGVTTALLGGWFAGFLIWSPMLPRQVIAAAEAAAGDRPYCIQLEKGPAQSARDLTGWNMRFTHTDGFIEPFYALLVIRDTSDRRYMGWSYRTGRFEPAWGDVGPELGRTSLCRPKAHFARDWL